MSWSKYIICIICSMTCTLMYAQNDRDYIRCGNKLFHAKEYAKAEVQYRKALSKNGNNTIALYNLGNALLGQGKPKDAMKQYEKVAQMEKNKVRLGRVYHNMGVIFQSQKNYAEAINCYKSSLRQNPHDGETRYNLALCQRLQKNNPQQNKNQEKKNNKNKDKGNNKDKDSKQKDRQKQQQNNNQNQMSKDNAEQLLNAVMQDERSIQDKMKKMQRSGGKSLEKNW